MDIATEEQARMKPVQSHVQDDNDRGIELIEILSSDEEEDKVPVQSNARTQGDTSKQDPRQRPGERGTVDNCLFVI